MVQYNCYPSRPSQAPAFVLLLNGFRTKGMPSTFLSRSSSGLSTKIYVVRYGASHSRRVSRVTARLCTSILSEQTPHAVYIGMLVSLISLILFLRTDLHILSTNI
ncbi:hypothetical protein BYT27DRAFT_6847267 [Phlegmacium glaucopus]|nr:hypothetical protein BYT27DRAFT_6847267 [Phlegmacium glaucopus]